MAKRTLYQDLGFGTKITESGDRLIKKDGSFNITRKGEIGWNTYQTLTRMPDGQFAVAALLFFILVNCFFAILFLMVGIEQLNGVPEGDFFSDFLYASFFSVQTFTTVGYGAIFPEGIAANMVASICAGVGLLAFAVITGLFFARFSQPLSHIAFSEKAILSPYRDGMSFQCRIVNVRDHKIINLTAQMSVTWLEESDGVVKRHYRKLDLERDEVVLFPLNWTLVHPITEESPIFGKTLEDLKKIHAEFLVMITGFDESYKQIIHADSSYICGEIEEGVKFKPMYRTSADKSTVLHLDKLSETEKK